MPEEKLLSVADKEIVDLVMKNRRGEVTIKPGFDGVYGVPVIDGREIVMESDDEDKPRKKMNEPMKPTRTQTGLGDYF